MSRVCCPFQIKYMKLSFNEKGSSVLDENYDPEAAEESIEMDFQPSVVNQPALIRGNFPELGKQ